MIKKLNVLLLILASTPLMAADKNEELALRNQVAVQTNSAKIFSKNDDLKIPLLLLGV